MTFGKVGFAQLCVCNISNIYFLANVFMDRFRKLAKFFMIMCFVVKLVYTKVVDNLCI